MNLFLIALWAFLKAHPDATFDDFQLAAERARKLTEVAGMKCMIGLRRHALGPFESVGEAQRQPEGAA